MPDEERSEWLFNQFKEFFPAWKKDIQNYVPIDRNTIQVNLKRHTGEKLGYIFGDGGTDDWHLERVGHSQK